MDKENVAYTYNGILLNIEKMKILSHFKMRINLVDSMLSNVSHKRTSTVFPCP